VCVVATVVSAIESLDDGSRGHLTLSPTISARRRRWRHRAIYGWTHREAAAAPAATGAVAQHAEIHVGERASPRRAGDAYKRAICLQITTWRRWRRPMSVRRYAMTTNFRILECYGMGPRQKSNRRKKSNTSLNHGITCELRVWTTSPLSFFCISGWSGELNLFRPSVYCVRHFGVLIWFCSGFCVLP